MDQLTVWTGRSSRRLAFNHSQTLLILSPVLLKIWIVQIFLQRLDQTCRCVLEVRDRNVDNVVELPDDAEVVYHLVGLLDEGFVDIKGFGRVGFGHLKVMF
jgi:hypothetical protein